MSKKDIKEFLLRGTLFGGLGSIIVGFVLWMVSLGIDDFYLSGGHIFLAIVSGYILAFVQAGTTAFHQIESWSVVKSCGLQFLLLYITYLGAYLINSWIEFRWEVVLIFTGIFIITYLLICSIVIIVIKCVTKKLNSKLK